MKAIKIGKNRKSVSLELIRYNHLYLNSLAKFVPKELLQTKHLATGGTYTVSKRTYTRNTHIIREKRHRDIQKRRAIGKSLAYLDKRATYLISNTRPDGPPSTHEIANVVSHCACLLYEINYNGNNK